VNQTPDLLRAVRLLVENGIRVNESGGRAKGFGSSLHILCETNQTSHLLSVARYLVESGSIVNLRDDKNNTVLHLLSRYNQTDHLLPVIRFLVEAGFTDVDIKAKLRYTFCVNIINLISYPTSSSS
jgi:ankyrin repeat protein